MTIGASTPPTAAMMGSSAWRMFVSSPAVISYLISRPTSRKNTAMKMSLMTSATGMDTIVPPNTKPRSNSRNCSKYSMAGVLAMMSATIAAASMRPAAFVEE